MEFQANVRTAFMTISSNFKYPDHFWIVFLHPSYIPSFLLCYLAVGSVNCTAKSSLFHLYSSSTALSSWPTTGPPKC